MNYLKIFILLSLFSLAGNAFSQTYSTKKGDRNFKKPDYEKAIEVYKKLYAKENTNELRIKLAESYRLSGNYKEAADWYKLAVNSGEVQPVHIYNYGQVLKRLENYPAAKEQFKKYHILEPGKNGEQLALSCDLVKQFKKQSSRYQITSVTFNSEEDDFSPVPMDSGLIFCSSRYNAKRDLYDWYKTDKYIDLYFVQHPADSAVPAPLKGTINSTYHEGPAAPGFSSTILYFTRNFRSSGAKRRDKDNNFNFQIYTAKQSKKGSWKKVRKFVHNNREYSIGHPTLTADGSRLYFTSNQPGGYGGYDLYVCYKEGDRFAKPINLGPAINTPGNEMFPRMDKDGALYFASDGHIGMGGLDIFTATENPGGWGSVNNLGYPVNTSMDDFGLFMAGETSGFFSSNRAGGAGGDDIYSVEIGKFDKTGEDDEFEFEEGDTSMITLVGNIMNPMTNEPEAGVGAYIINKLTNTREEVKTDDKGRFVFHINPESVYELKLEKDELSNKNLDFSTLGVKGGSVINLQDIIIEAVVLQDIYYEVNEFRVKPTAYAKLDSLVNLLQKSPEISIEISSHTDSRGSFEYNMDLSWKRAFTAQDYILSKGISSTRVTAYAFGEQRLLNNCYDGTPCTEEQHRVNRRTVFKILKPVRF